MANYKRTKCTSYEFGKVHSRTNKVNSIKKNPMKYQDINNDHIMPGHMLSADHYILWATGRLYHTQKGKSDPSDM